MGCFERTARVHRCLLCGRPGGHLPGRAGPSGRVVCPSCVADLQTEAARRLRGDLGGRIVGQERAVSVLAAAAYRHHRRERRRGDGHGPPADSVLVCGPPGVGKTRLIQAAARSLGLPFVSIDGLELADATAGTPLGVFERLTRAAGGDPRRARFGIVHVERLDELATFDRPRLRGPDVALRAQLNLAALLGAAGTSRDRSMGAPDGLADVLFVAEARLDREGRAGSDPGDVRNGSPPDDPTPPGLLPELAACFPVAVGLDRLGTDDLLRVLLEPADGIWGRYRALLAARGATLDADEEALAAIAVEAGRRGRGGWGLQEAVDELLLDLAFDLRPADRRREARLVGNAFATLRVLCEEAPGSWEGARP